jgi:hypothetical protein
MIQSKDLHIKHEMVEIWLAINTSLSQRTPLSSSLSQQSSTYLLLMYILNKWMQNFTTFMVALKKLWCSVLLDITKHFHPLFFLYNKIAFRLVKQTIQHFTFTTNEDGSKKCVVSCHRVTNRFNLTEKLCKKSQPTYFSPQLLFLSTMSPQHTRDSLLPTIITNQDN